MTELEGHSVAGRVQSQQVEVVGWGHLQEILLIAKDVHKTSAHLILSKRGLWLAKKSRLLGCCKVPDGCQTHLGRAKVKKKL